MEQQRMIGPIIVNLSKTIEDCPNASDRPPERSLLGSPAQVRITVTVSRVPRGCCLKAATRR